MESEKKIEKQDKIIQLLTQIEKNTRPAPRWKKILLFIFTHLLTIIGLILIAYISWNIFKLLGSVSDKVTTMKDTLTELFTIPEGLRFWE